MKKIKTILAAVMCVAMLLTIAVPAFAATQNNLDSGNTDVYATYVAGDRPVSYSVDLAWGAMQFEYNAHETWDDENHVWVQNNPDWAAIENSNYITVENNSSVELKAGFTFAGSKGELTGDFTATGSEFNSDTDTLTIPVATANEDAAVYTVNFTPNGTIPTVAAGLEKIGTITVTLNV